jgi:hypothetical protein
MGRGHLEATCSARQQIFTKLHRMTIVRKCKDSVSDLLFDIVALGHYIGPCLSEYT